MEQQKTLISVIIPVYNVAEYVRKCVRSVLDNIYRELEVICVDDGSTDQSGDILNQMAADDSRLKVIHQENAGVAEARNRGLIAAQGKYIAFIDSDDYIHPQYFTSMLSCMDARDASLVVCGCRKFDEKEKIEIVPYRAIHYKKVSQETFFNNRIARNMIWARLYRREDIGVLRFSPEVRISDDTLFNLSVISNIENIRVYVTETPMYYYLNRSTSITHHSKEAKFFDFGKWYAKNYKLVEKGDWNCLVCVEAVKLTLAYRYLTSYFADANRRTEDANVQLMQWLRKIKRSGQIPNGVKIAHICMVYFPQLYRKYRIMNDPSMKDWEEKQRIEAERSRQTFHDQRDTTGI